MANGAQTMCAYTQVDGEALPHVCEGNPASGMQGSYETVGEVGEQPIILTASSTMSEHCIGDAVLA